LGTISVHVADDEVVDLGRERTAGKREMAADERSERLRRDRRAENCGKEKQMAVAGSHG
jgi:hypothetical protein